MKSITAAMKEIKLLEERKEDLLRNESSSFTYSYTKDEKPLLDGYDYLKTRKDVDEIDSQIRKIKYAINKANVEIKLEGTDLTIAEGLVMLGQLQRKKDRLNALSSYKQLSRVLTRSGDLEYTECAYDVSKIKKDYMDVCEQITNIQVLIDKANLLTEISY